MPTDTEVLVEKFYRSPFKFAFASKLRDHGPAVCPYLEAALREATLDATTLRLAASVLLHFGSPLGAPHLLADLTETGDAPFSALQLANAGIIEAREPIARLLAGDVMRRLPNEAFVLIDAHQKFGPLEAELQQHLRTLCPDKLRADLERVLAP